MNGDHRGYGVLARPRQPPARPTPGASKARTAHLSRTTRRHLAGVDGNVSSDGSEVEHAICGAVHWQRCERSTRDIHARVVTPATHRWAHAEGTATSPWISPTRRWCYSLKSWARDASSRPVSASSAPIAGELKLLSVRWVSSTAQSKRPAACSVRLLELPAGLLHRWVATFELLERGGEQLQLRSLEMFGRLEALRRDLVDQELEAQRPSLWRG